MRVLGWLADTSACGYYRLQQPFAALREAGIDAVDAVEWTGNDMLDADLTVVQRVSTPIPCQLMMLAREHGAKFVYEVDDYLLGLDPTNAVYAHYQQDIVRNSMLLAMGLCEAMTVSTEPLAEMMQPLVDYPVYVLPNCLPDYFEQLGASVVGRPAWTERPEILWAGSATHAGDFGAEAQYGLKRAMQWAGAGLTVMGHDYRRQLKAPDANFVGWSADIPAFHSGLPGYDIGLCPLNATRFNRAKSGLKAMEYQAAGIVPVATDCDAYRGVITDGVDGFLCSTQVQWKDALMTLCTEPDTLLRMRAAGLRNTSSRLYSTNASQWADVYSKVV